ncbi:MAG: Polyketide cyclase / dehydrase and lipid transport [Candidatus Scalindua rubra]|uniref:Polyketide cyclase / dehydrase and lipid transport n=1 Tax=Candidatus Scalindua rubra TaxID=1872076 RepID=A0A1E3X494_9BACT|nr:MAG: Polyketide cyclase / dehydrase and lipid transport [Candidatus Scalindua rubra]
MKDKTLIIISSGHHWPIKIRGKIFIKSNKEKVWQVLTDYDHLTEFVPNLVESIHSLDGDGNYIVQQKLAVNVPIFKRIIKQEILVKEEKYPEILTYKATRGDMEIFEGDWLLEENEGNKEETLLTYNCNIKPIFYAPLWIFKVIYKNEVIATLNAIRDRSLKAS